MMNHGADTVADCIGDDVALAPLDLLSGIKPALPAGFGGLERLAAITPAVGDASRSAISRACMTGTRPMRSRVPSRQTR
jgi:hypothetical protein